MPEDVGFVVALMLAAVLTAAGLPSENIVYPRILQSRDLNGEKTLYIRAGLVLSLEKGRVFSENFVFSEDDGVNRLHTAMNGKDLENNFYEDRNRTSVVFVDEVKGTVQVRGILNNKFSIEPIASSRRSEDDLVAHTLLYLDDIDNPLDDNSVTERNLKNLPEEFVVEVRIYLDPSFGPNKTMADFIQYFGLVMNKVNQYYKQLSKPRVQFSVLSITRLTNYTFTRLIPDPAGNRSKIHLCGTVRSFEKYVNATLTKDTQDAILYVSSLSGGFITGCSSYCHVCKKNPITTQTMIFGPPGTREPYIIARQLGHLLGMSHEGRPPVYYTPGNKNLRCEKKDFGYVLGTGKPPHYFSHCLQDQARGCLMTKTKQCFEQTGGKKIF
uniref:Putative tick metalloprotease n=1 Tax=Ixodes ricinus TaxID=34613 RepID=V5GHI5_IXORI